MENNEVMFEVDLNLKGLFFIDAKSKEEVEEKIRHMLYNEEDKKRLIYKIVNSFKYEYKIDNIKEVF